MPRENVYLAGERTAIVGWDKDAGGVQLGIQQPHTFVFFDPADGQPLDEAITSTALTAPHSSLHADLNREQINELIRVLRRARDQAFGRDE